MSLKRIHILESKLNIFEDVYTKNLDRNNKKAKITYRKGYNIGSNKSVAPKEAIKTDKMDSSSSDTYIVPLKNGINSYNITDIDGKEIMHYFKRYFSNEATNMQVKINGQLEDYRLEMENNEFQNFLRQFIDKISFVVNDYVSKHKELTNRKIYGLSQICVYPVKSSSNFNSKITDLIQSYNQTIYGLPVVKLNENLLRKDVSNMQKDEDFVNKNAKYYNSYREKGYVRPHGNETHMNALNTDINMFKARQKVTAEVLELNDLIDEMAKYLELYRSNPQEYGKPLADLFIEYSRRSTVSAIMSHSAFKNEYTGEYITKQNVFRKERTYIYFEPLEETRWPQETLKQLKVIAKTFNLPEYRKLDNDAKYKVEIIKRKPLDFQIKKIFNDSRMGMKNFFSFDPNELKKAKEEIEGNVLVIFDDNVSGGATLSDICAQFINVGVKHIIPITFGRMFQQWGGRSNVDGEWSNIREPEDGFVFGDGKTFVFRNRTFKADEITNPMDAANMYQQTFGEYDQEGAVELWNICRSVKGLNKKPIPNVADDNAIPNKRGRQPYSEEERQKIINDLSIKVEDVRNTIQSIGKAIKATNNLAEKEKLINKRNELYLKRNALVARIYNLSTKRKMTQGARDRANMRRKMSEPF